MWRTSWSDRIERLDPEHDHLEVHRLVCTHEFPWDTLQALSFALFRTYAVPSIGALLDRGLAPAAVALAGRPAATCDEKQLAAVRNGRSLPLPEGMRLAVDESVALFDPEGRLAAVAAFDPRDATLRPRVVLPAG